MRINFRQGLISFQKDNGSAVFLHPSTTPGFVTHVVSPVPTVVAVAHGQSDYLLHFDKQVDNAWGPITSGTNNYLFWDIDLLTAEVTYGITLVSPIVSAIEPPKVHDQHWFDLSTTTMKVWNEARNKWQVKARVFAGTVVNGNVNNIVHQLQGTQAVLEVPGNPGFIMRDTMLQPLRKSNGEFLTDDSQVRVETTVGTAGVLVQPVNRIVPVRAGENIPAMSLVYFSDDDTVRLASSNPSLTPARIPVGIMLEAIVAGDVGHLSPFGEITHDQWNWSGKAGQPMYVDQFGQLTLDRPSGVFAYRAGFVKNKNTVLLGIDAETYPQVYQADTNSLLIIGETPVEIEDTVNGIGERVVTVSVKESSVESNGLMSSSQVLQLGANTTDITQLKSDVDALSATKANIQHSHLIDDVTGLQALLDQKSDVGHAHNEYAPINHTHSEFATADHSHTIPQISGLQVELNNRANRNHLNSFSEIYSSVDRNGLYDVGQGQTLSDALSLKADVAHVHPISAVTGLQTELDGKSNVNHIHNISEIPGLQTELDNRAFIVHTHSMAQVNGLTAALASKSDVLHNHDGVYANVLHGHEISEVVGLQTSLDSKAPLSHDHDDRYATILHTHQISNVDGLQDSLDSKASVIHSHDGVYAPFLHTHEITDVAGLQTALSSKASISHTHLSSSITDFKSAVSSQFVAGENITLQVDQDNIVTINAVGGTQGNTSFTISNGSMFEDVQRFTVPYDFSEIVFPNLDVDAQSGSVSIPPILFKNSYTGSVVQSFPNANATPSHRMQIVFGSGLHAEVTGTWGESLLVTATNTGGGTTTSMPNDLRYLAADGNASQGTATGDVGPTPQDGDTSRWNSTAQTWESNSNIRVDASKSVFINYPKFIDNPDGSSTVVPVTTSESSIFMMTGGDGRADTEAALVLSSPAMTGSSWVGIRAGNGYDANSGGEVYIVSGSAVGTDVESTGGNITFETGSSNTGSSGSIILKTGTNGAPFGSGGGIELHTNNTPRLRVSDQGTFIYNGLQNWVLNDYEGNPGQVITKTAENGVQWSDISVESVVGLPESLAEIARRAGQKFSGVIEGQEGQTEVCSTIIQGNERVCKYIATLTRGESDVQMTELTVLMLSATSVQTQIIAQMGNATLGTFIAGVDNGNFVLVFNKTVPEPVTYSIVAKYF